MPYYDNWKDLAAAAQQKCRLVLEKDVAPIAERILREHIESDIYGSYTPEPGAWVNGSTYQRRHILSASVYSFMRSEDELMITSDTKASKPIIRGYSFHHRRPT